MAEQGIVHAVEVVTLGSYVAAAASATDTKLLVESVLDFNEDGGTISLNGVTYTYSAADYDTDALTIVGGLTDAAAEGDRVQVLPLSVEKHAKVIVADADDALTAVVPFALFDRVPEGIRDTGAEESVVIELTDSGRYVVQNVVGREPLIDASYLDPDTSPGDGEPPASSPTPVVNGTVGAILVRWTPITNSTLVEYEVHVSTDPNFAPSDVFDDFSGDLSKWPASESDDPSGSFSIEGGRAKLVMPTPGAGDYVYFGTGVMDMTDRAITAEVEVPVFPTDLQEFTFGVSAVSVDPVEFYTADWTRFGETGLLPSSFLDGESDTGPLLTYDADEHRYLRVRFDGPNLHWETSGTGVTWTTHWTKEHLLPVDVLRAMSINFSLGDSDIGSTEDPATVYIDNVTMSPADTEVVTTAGSSTTVRTINGQPLQYGTDYYFRIVAKDTDGSAEPSAVVSGQMKQADNEDISALYAYLGNVFVDQLVGGTLQAEILLAGIIRTAESGARVEQGPFGIVIYDPSGTPIAVFPTDGSGNKLRSDLEADSLTVTGGMALRATGAHEISKGATLTLQSATTAAQSPPSYVIEYPGSQFAPSFSQGYGLVWADSQFNSILDLGIPTIKRTSGGDIELGISSSPRPWGGFTKIGTAWYTLGKHPTFDTYFITKYDSSGDTVEQVTYTPLDGANGSGGSTAFGLAPAAIGTDGTNVLVAEFDDANNRFRIQTRDPDDLTVSSTLNTGTNAGFNGPVVGVLGGSFDLGATRFIILSKNGNHFWPFNSSGTYQPNEAWAPPFPGSMSGATWDGTRFWSTRARHIFANAYVYKHTTHKWSGTDPLTWHATTTWRDTDAGGTGTHETDMGQVTSFSMRKRAAVTLTAAAIPDSGGTDDPNAVAFYLSNTDTSRTSFWRQTLPADGVNTVTVGDDITFSGTNPPASNNFPDATPATVESADGSLVVSGNGTYKGKAIELTDGWVTSGTVTFSATGGGFSLGNGTVTSRYRDTGNGVDLQILFTIGSTTNMGTGRLQATIAGGIPAGIVGQCGTVCITDATGSSTWNSGSVRFSTSTVLDVVAAVGAVTATNPITFGSGDSITIGITYQPA